MGLKKPDIFQRILPTDLIELLAKTATDTEDTAEQAQRQYKPLQGRPTVDFRLRTQISDNLSLFHAFTDPDETAERFARRPSAQSSS